MVELQIEPNFQGPKEDEKTGLWRFSPLILVNNTYLVNSTERRWGGIGKENRVSVESVVSHHV